MQKYVLNEIFYSLQGEGRWTGYPAIFIRFSGCTLKCHFCDTDHSPKIELNCGELVRHIRRWQRCTRVVLTGGEPLLQVDANLLYELHSCGYRIHIETNGTIDYIPGLALIRWLTVSPKENWVLKTGDELKVVYTGQDLDQYMGIGINFKHYFLQPCSMANIDETRKAVLENPQWNLSLQTQKVLKIR